MDEHQSDSEEEVENAASAQHYQGPAAASSGTAQQQGQSQQNGLISLRGHLIGDREGDFTNGPTWALISVPHLFAVNIRLLACACMRKPAFKPMSMTPSCPSSPLCCDSLQACC